MVNVEKVEELLVSLKDLDPDDFSMKFWIKLRLERPPLRCIAGQTLLNEGYTAQQIRGMGSETIFKTARTILGINKECADWLFREEFNPKDNRPRKPTTLAQAISATELALTTEEKSELMRWAISEDGSKFFLE